MAAVGAGIEARPAMVSAITSVRHHGLKTGALTNNWPGDPSDNDRGSALTDWFDVVVESAVEGLRKPDPRIYRLVCDRLEVTPTATVFLDDLGANLKPARELGMTTIKVADPDAALAELEAALGFPLLADPWTSC
jgi:putative hydrolase of the HAD superfamily